MHCRKFLCLISNLSEAFAKPRIRLVRIMAQFSSTTRETSSTGEKEHVTKHYNSFLLPHDVAADDEMKRSMLSTHRHGLLMINSDTMDAAWAKRIWHHCEFKICADGGANRLYDGLIASDDVHKYIPDMIKGDLDSLRADVKAFYSAAGTRIVYDLDQDHNDLDKCLTAMQQHWQQHAPTSSSSSSSVEPPVPSSSSVLPMVVVVLGAFGGRFDQELAAVHSVYQWQQLGPIHDSTTNNNKEEGDHENAKHKDRGIPPKALSGCPLFHRIVLVGGENVACLLGSGRHEVLPVTGVEGPTCALLPVGGPVRCCSTTGLQWDLQNQRLEMGHLVSSSNHIVGGGISSSNSTGDSAGGGTTTNVSDRDSNTVSSDSNGSSNSSSNSKVSCVMVHTSDPVLWMTTLIAPSPP